LEGIKDIREKYKTIEAYIKNVNLLKEVSEYKEAGCSWRVFGSA
jgi:hypothetical protein